MFEKLRDKPLASSQERFETLIGRTTNLRAFGFARQCAYRRQGGGQYRNHQGSQGYCGDWRQW